MMRNIPFSDQSHAPLGELVAVGSGAPSLPGCDSGAPPHPAFGHPLPVGAREECAAPGPSGPFAVEMAAGGGLQLRRNLARPKLSLVMIVRDSAQTMPACLESIRPWVDEMIIVDTGSVDETPRIVESFGGKLFHFPWCDDFSAARNGRRRRLDSAMRWKCCCPVELQRESPKGSGTR